MFRQQGAHLCCCCLHRCSCSSSSSCCCTLPAPAQMVQVGFPCCQPACFTGSSYSFFTLFPHGRDGWQEELAGPGWGGLVLASLHRRGLRWADLGLQGKGLWWSDLSLAGLDWTRRDPGWASRLDWAGRNQHHHHHLGQGGLITIKMGDGVACGAGRAHISWRGDHGLQGRECRHNHVGSSTMSAPPLHGRHRSGPPRYDTLEEAQKNIRNRMEYMRAVRSGS